MDSDAPKPTIIMKRISKLRSCGTAEIPKAPTPKQMKEIKLILKTPITSMRRPVIIFPVNSAIPNIEIKNEVCVSS